MIVLSENGFAHGGCTLESTFSVKSNGWCSIGHVFQGH